MIRLRHYAIDLRVRHTFLLARGDRDSRRVFQGARVEAGKLEVLSHPDALEAVRNMDFRLAHFGTACRS